MSKETCKYYDLCVELFEDDVDRSKCDCGACERYDGFLEGECLWLESDV